MNSYDHGDDFDFDDDDDPKESAPEAGGTVGPMLLYLVGLMMILGINQYWLHRNLSGLITAEDKRMDTLLEHHEAIAKVLDDGYEARLKIRDEAQERMEKILRDNYEARLKIRDETLEEKRKIIKLMEEGGQLRDDLIRQLEISAQEQRRRADEELKGVLRKLTVEELERVLGKTPKKLTMPRADD